MVVTVLLFRTEEAPPTATPKAAGGEGGGLFGSDDEGDDLFFTPTKSLTKATPTAASTESQTSADKSMTSDQKAALRYVRTVVTMIVS